MTAPRILQVAPYLHPAPAYGGTPRVVHGLAAALARAGLHVEVLTTDAFASGRRRAPRIASPYPAHALPNWSNALAYRAKLFLPRGLSGWIADHLRGFDLVHLHELRTALTYRVAAACRRWRIPHLVSGHGGFPHHGRWRLAKRGLDALLLPELLAGASRLVAASQFERRQLVEFGIEPGRIEVLPHGIDPGEFAALPARGALRRALGLGPRPLVLFLGRIDAIKGLGLLLEGFARARQALPQAALVLAGPEQRGAAELRGAIESKGLAAAVVWTGVLGDAERLQALVDADLLCFPSDQDCFGLAPFEALACGTPVVALSGGGSGEWLAKTGGAELVAPEAEALGAAIVRVLADPASERARAERAAAEIRRHLAWDAIASDYAALYGSLCRPAAGPAAARSAAP
ncbi:MAG TPA: glycosyltransferase [Acidobacteriota bacterium]